MFTPSAASTSRSTVADLVAVMGPSGSGKSTLLTIAGSLEEPTTGEVLSTAPRCARCRETTRLGFADARSDMSSRTSTCWPGSPPRERVSPPRARRRCGQAGARGRDGRARRARPRRSGRALPGPAVRRERQRVSIARAVVGERHLLLADEPSGALDSTNGEAVMRLIHDACKRGVAAVVVTHDAHLASWADRIVFLRDGHVVDLSPTQPHCSWRRASFVSATVARTQRSINEHCRSRAPSDAAAPRRRSARPACRRPVGLAALPQGVAPAVPDPRPHHLGGRRRRSSARPSRRTRRRRRTSASARRRTQRPSRASTRMRRARSRSSSTVSAVSR